MLKQSFQLGSSKHNQGAIVSGYKNTKTQQDISKTEVENIWKQHPEGSSATRIIKIRCRCYRSLGHKKAQCPGKKAGGKSKSNKRARWEKKQRNKKRKARHQERDRTFQKIGDASPLPSRYNLRSNPRWLSENLERDYYNRQQPKLHDNTGSTPLICFTCRKPGHKSYVWPEKEIRT